MVKTKNKGKNRYKKIAEAIYLRVREDGMNANELLRRWIHMFEISRVVGWDRSLFLDAWIEVKEREDAKLEEKK